MEASEGLPARHSSSPRVRPVGCGPARHHDPGDRHRTRDSGRAWRGGHLSVPGPTGVRHCQREPILPQLFRALEEIRTRSVGRLP
jgi:hypothetical protein